MNKDFPQGFLWGTATAAHQVEGNNNNSDFWVMEHLPNTIFAEPSGDAIDHYHRYEEDIAMQDMQALPGGEAARDKMRAEIQDVFLEAAVDDDFVGVQTYSRERYGAEGNLGPEEGMELTQMGYEFWPASIGATLQRAHEMTNLPLYVTENGIGTEDDTRRLAYYQTALQHVLTGLKNGLDIRGYFAWSAFDDFEWMLGYRPTFGIIAVDRHSQQRTVKPSARWLSQVAQANAFIL